MQPDQIYQRIEQNLKGSGGNPANLGEAMTDISALYNMLLNARNEARTDTLTQLPNFKGLTEILEREESNAKRYKEPLTVAFIDFVGLKQYNDTYRHVQANYAIQSVANTIKLSVRETDILGRYGGDEFCIILPKTTKEEAKKPIKRIVHRLNNLTIDAVVDDLPDENYKHVAVSIGYTQLRPDETYKEALNRADKAMYKAKRVQKKLNSKRTRFRSA